MHHRPKPLRQMSRSKFYNEKANQPQIDGPNPNPVCRCQDIKPIPRSAQSKTYIHARDRRLLWNRLLSVGLPQHASQGSGWCIPHPGRHWFGLFRYFSKTAFHRWNHEVSKPASYLHRVVVELSLEQQRAETILDHWDSSQLYSRSNLLISGRI